MVTVVTWEWEKVEQAISNLTDSLRARNIKPDFIVALSRGGLIPAALLEDTLGLTSDIYSIPVTHYKKGQAEKGGEVVIGAYPKVSVTNKTILIVDDLIDSGDTLRAIIPLFHDAKLIVAVLAQKTLFEYGSTQVFSGIGALPSEWIVFPWELNEFKGLLNNE